MRKFMKSFDNKRNLLHLKFHLCVKFVNFRVGLIVIGLHWKYWVDSQWITLVILIFRVANEIGKSRWINY